MLETDPSEVLNEIIYATRKGGNIGIGASALPCRPSGDACDAQHTHSVQAPACTSEYRLSYSC